MSSAITSTSVPNIGTIAGYAVPDSTGTFPNVAEVINQFVDANGNIVPITTQNTLQFANLDAAPINHSAVGLPGKNFPKPVNFPSPLASPTSSTIGPDVQWSTGQVPPFEDTQQAPCFSQTFTLKVGTYYFGDLSYYNSANVQDVVVVGTPTPSPKALHRIAPYQNRPIFWRIRPKSRPKPGI